MRRFRIEAAPLVLALILGPLLEDNLRQALIISRGSFQIFFNRPISACFMLAAFFIIVSSVVRLRPPKEAKEAE